MLKKGVDRIGQRRVMRARRRGGGAPLRPGPVSASRVGEGKGVERETERTEGSELWTKFGTAQTTNPDDSQGAAGRETCLAAASFTFWHHVRKRDSTDDVRCNASRPWGVTSATHPPAGGLSITI